MVYLYLGVCICIWVFVFVFGCLYLYLYLCLYLGICIYIWVSGWHCMSSVSSDCVLVGRDTCIVPCSVVFENVKTLVVNRTRGYFHIIETLGCFNIR